MARHDQANHALASTVSTSSQSHGKPGGAIRHACDRFVPIAKAWISQASFSRDTTASFALALFSAALSLITTLILAGLIGAANYGIYAVSIVYANVFAFIACLGFPQLIIRAEACKADAPGRIRAATIIKTGTGYALTASCALAVVGLVLAPWILPDSASYGWTAFAVAMVMVIPITFQRLREAILLGRSQPVLSALPERLIRPSMMFLAVCALALFFHDGLTATDAMIAQGLAYVVSIAGAIYLVTRTASPSDVRRPPTDALLVKESLPFLLVGMTTLLAGRIDIMMLSMLTDAETVGQYRLAAQVAAVVMMVTTISQSVLSPRISKLSHDNNLGQFVRRLPVFSAGLFFAAALASVVIYLGFGLALPWLGQDFTDASPSLAVLLTAFTVTAGLSPALPLLTMTGNASKAALANVISIGINVTFNVLLIPPFGGLGAAIAMAISLISLYVFYAVLALQSCKAAG